MYKIKQNPEDFIVNEIIQLKIKENGRFMYYKLEKRDYTTIRALETIAKKNNLKLKDIGFAGTKDKKAVTTQYISVPKKISIDNENIKLKFVGNGNEPISLGDNIGNEFIIVIRDLDFDGILCFEKFFNEFEINNLKEDEKNNLKLTDENKELKNKESKTKKIKNYFGEQRFSKNNALIGKSIIKKEFEKTVKLILENKGDYETKVKEHLNKKPNDFVGAIKLIPLKIRKMFVHAYQSYLWNNLAEKLDLENIPIIGFSTEFKDEKIKQEYEKILKNEGITKRDFIIRQIPSLSSEGGDRDVFMEIEGFKILNKSEHKVTIKFKLNKGSYATELIRQILS